MFRMRDFAGYIGFPIPHLQDARVLAALRDRAMRDRMNPDDVGILAIFCHRKAVEAVRTHDVAMLREGLLGIAVASELNGDYREVCMGLAVLFYCARLLHVTDKEIIDWAVASGFSQQTVDTLPLCGQKAPGFRHGDEWPPRPQASTIRAILSVCTLPTT